MKKIANFFRRIFYGTFVRIFYGAILITALVFWWPQGPDFTEMGQLRDINLMQNQDALVVGVSWPIQLRGPSLVNGMELAISRIAELGLIGDMPIELVVRDDEGEIIKAQDIAGYFAGRPDMSAVIGFSENHQAISAAVVYQTAKLLQIVVGAASTDLTERDQPYLVRTIPSAKIIAGKLSDATGEAPLKFAVITEINGYMEEFAQQFTLAQKNKGGSRIYRYTYPSELPVDFVRSTYQIRALDADFILFSGHAKEAGLFAKQARRIGLDIPIMCACIDVRTLKRTAGKDAQGIMLPGFYQLDLDTEENKHFVAAYQKRFSTAPDGWAAQGYDAMLILAHAVAESGSLNSLDLSWSIKYMTSVEGASGNYVFSPEGDLIDKRIYMRTISASNN